MNIAKNRVVAIDYTLSDSAGNVLDSSRGGQPLVYLHGVGSLVPGLESALEGQASGASISVTIPPEKAYGTRDEALVQPVPRERFVGIEDLEVGKQLQAQTEVGPRIVKVVEITDESVTIDANHELAGMTLHFDITVVEVREATPDELNHGHAHGPGGHEH